MQSSSVHTFCDEASNEKRDKGKRYTIPFAHLIMLIEMILFIYNSYVIYL